MKNDLYNPRTEQPTVRLEARDGIVRPVAAATAVAVIAVGAAIGAPRIVDSMHDTWNENQKNSEDDQKVDLEYMEQRQDDLKRATEPQSAPAVNLLPDVAVDTMPEATHVIPPTDGEA